MFEMSSILVRLPVELLTQLIGMLDAPTVAKLWMCGDKRFGYRMEHSSAVESLKWSPNGLQKSLPSFFTKFASLRSL